MTDPPPWGERLFAPWRQTYLDDMDANERARTPATQPDSQASTFLAEYWAAPHLDRRNHVIVRTPDGMILLNKFPYAGGHLLVALGAPAPALWDYSPAQRAALWALVDTAAELMRRALEPQGVNIGLNQGRAAGAGVPSHLHAHLVPRWNGDVNFMASVAGVRVIPSALDVMGERYRRVWVELRASSES